MNFFHLQLYTHPGVHSIHSQSEDFPGFRVLFKGKILILNVPLAISAAQLMICPMSIFSLSSLNRYSYSEPPPAYSRKQHRGLLSHILSFKKKYTKKSRKTCRDKKKIKERKKYVKLQEECAFLSDIMRKCLKTLIVFQIFPGIQLTGCLSVRPVLLSACVQFDNLCSLWRCLPPFHIFTAEMNQLSALFSKVSHLMRHSRCGKLDNQAENCSTKLFKTHKGSFDGAGVNQRDVEQAAFHLQTEAIWELK